MVKSNPINIFVDVDDTLVRSAGAKRIPIPSVIKHVRELHARGATLFCWSAAGTEYAEQSAKELGMAECFSAFLSKPNAMIDDQKMTDWPRCSSIHPSECNDRSLDSYRSQLK